MTTPYGYFNEPTQTVPVFDPGLDIPCLICHHPLDSPMVTISFMVQGDTRSYFYRAHKWCYTSADPEMITDMEGQMVDAIYKTKEQN